MTVGRAIGIDQDTASTTLFIGKVSFTLGAMIKMISDHVNSMDLLIDVSTNHRSSLSSPVPTSL